MLTSTVVRLLKTTGRGHVIANKECNSIWSLPYGVMIAASTCHVTLSLTDQGQQLAPTQSATLIDKVATSVVIVA